MTHDPQRPPVPDTPILPRGVRKAFLVVAAVFVLHFVVCVGVPWALDAMWWLDNFIDGVLGR